MIELILTLLGLATGWGWDGQFDHAVVVSDLDLDGHVESYGSTFHGGYRGDITIEGQWHNITYWYQGDNDPYTILRKTGRVVRTESWDNFMKLHKVSFTYDPEQYPTPTHEAVELGFRDYVTTNAHVQYQVRHTVWGGNHGNPQTWIYIERSNPKIQVWFGGEAIAHSVYFGNWDTYEAGTYWY